MSNEIKLIFTFLFFALGNTFILAQCFEDTHSTNVKDSWLSCDKNVNPHGIRGNSHWVLYDLGYFYKLDSAKIWNYNVLGETNKGIKNVIIDYSIDGINWNEASSAFLMEASGNSNYSGESPIELPNIDARYILFTAIDTWGDDCAGLSEVRFNIAGKVTDLNDVYADDGEIALYPNPTEGVFVIEGILESYKIDLLNAQGHLIRSLDSNTDQVIIDIFDLPAGMFFVRIENEYNQNLFLQKIIKL